MSYQDPWLDPMETGEMDPAMMDQAYIDYLVANGAGAGMVPDYQMTGKPLTVQNQIGAVNANRSALFDTAFQGLGGPQAFAPGAFDPTVSTSIRQSPELNQVYGYLRSPTSMEGIIAQEMMTGGTPATARRALQQLLTATPEEVAAVFAGYDQFFGRQPSVTVGDVDRIRSNLLLELPAAIDDATGQAMVKKEDGTGINWDLGEFSVDARANTIGELQAEIPRIGPSAPQWGVDPNTGQPIQTSAGGELSWGFDEQGNPVLMETTVTPSEAAQTFSDLGLPNPAEEYTAESFMTPDQVAMQQAYGEMEEPVAQLKAAWMDPSLAPTNTNGPNDRPWKAPANLTEEQLAGTSGQIAARDPGVTPEEMAMVDRVRQNALAPQGGPPSPSILDPQVIGPLAEQLIAEGQDIPPHWTYTINPDGSVGEPLPPEYQAGGPAGQSIGVTELMRRRAEGYPAVPPPPGPPSDNPVAEALDMFIRGSQPGTPGALPVQPDEYAAGSPATYDQYLAENPPLGPPRTPAYARPGAQPANQPGGPGFQPGATQADVDAMLAQLLPGNQQRSTNQPAYAQQGAQPANQPGGAGFQGGATQATIDAMLAQILPGNQQSTMNRPPPFAQPGAQPANQPGGPQYLEAIETGERRARQRQEDEQSASVLGGTTNRTGKRVRPTRTGEQARQYRQAFEAWDLATDQQQQAKQQAYTYETGRARGQAWRLQQQGVRPLDQALMARRLVLMNAGMPQGV